MRALDDRPKRFADFRDERVARRNLPQPNATTELASLRVRPENQLEALKGDHKGQHGIRVNDQ